MSELSAKTIVENVNKKFEVLFDNVLKEWNENGTNYSKDVKTSISSKDSDVLKIFLDNYCRKKSKDNYTLSYIATSIDLTMSVRFKISYNDNYTTGMRD